MTLINSKSKIIVFSIAFIIFWCSGYLAGNLTTGSLDPLSLLFYRYILTTVALFFIVLSIYRLRFFTEIKQYLTVTQATLGILYHVLYIGCVFYAIRLGLSAGVVAVIFAIQPMLTILISHGLERTTPSKFIFLGALLCIVGTALLSNITSVSQLAVLGTPLLVATFGLFSIAVATIIHSKVAIKMNVWPALFIQFLTATAALALVVIFDAEPLYTNIDGYQFLLIIFLVFFTTIGSYLLMNWLLANIKSASYSLLFYLVPPSVIFLECLLFGAQISQLQIAGSVLILVGVYISSRQAQRSCESGGA